MGPSLLGIPKGLENNRRERISDCTNWKQTQIDNQGSETLPTQATVSLGSKVN